VHDEARHSVGGQRSQGIQCLGLSRIRNVVTDPRFEQIAQDVQRVGVTRLAGEEVDELAGDVGPCRIDVQIRDEEDGQRRPQEAGGGTRSIFRITTGFSGAFSLNGPLAPVGTVAISSTTSMPWTTLPNTA
jgi:hypothetical protein